MIDIIVIVDGSVAVMVDDDTMVGVIVDDMADAMVEEPCPVMEKCLG